MALSAPPLVCPQYARTPASGGASFALAGAAPSMLPTRANRSTGVLGASHGTLGRNPWSQEPPAPDIPPAPVSSLWRQRRGLCGRPGVVGTPRLPALVNPWPRTTKPPAVWRGVCIEGLGCRES